jgi:hypothetical protein
MTLFTFHFAKTGIGAAVKALYRLPTSQEPVPTRTMVVTAASGKTTR